MNTEDYEAITTPRGRREAFDVVAELQRQQKIIEADRQLADFNDEIIPKSGEEGYQNYIRHVLREAGETYVITHGRKVSL